MTEEMRIADMIREMEKRVPRPEPAESPIWVFRDKSRVFCS